MRFKAKILGRGILILAAIAVVGLVVMLLWNAIVPGVFLGVRTLDYRQAVGLLILSRILFGGFRGRGGPGRHWKHLKHLTPEERALFQRRGYGPNREAGSSS